MDSDWDLDMDDGDSVCMEDDDEDWGDYEMSTSSNCVRKPNPTKGMVRPFPWDRIAFVMMYWRL